MPTLRQFAEKINRAGGGGVETDESKFDWEYLYSEIHSGRAVIARNDFKINRRWNPSLFQFYYPEYSTYFQSGTCFSRFKIPTGFISANPLQTGCAYLGSSNDVDEFNPFAAQNFLIIKTRTELNDLLNHQLLSPSKGLYIGALIEGQAVEVYSNTLIRNLGIGGVWDNPQSLPDFNPEKDQYPISEDLSELVITYLKETTFNQEASTPADVLSDTRQTVVVPQKMSTRINKNIS
jgi:hypothetical protein